MCNFKNKFSSARGLKKRQTNSHWDEIFGPFKVCLDLLDNGYFSFDKGGNCYHYGIIKLFRHILVMKIYIRSQIKGHKYKNRS